MWLLVCFLVASLWWVAARVVICLSLVSFMLLKSQLQFQPMSLMISFTFFLVVSHKLIETVAAIYRYVIMLKLIFFTALLPYYIFYVFLFVSIC